MKKIIAFGMGVGIATMSHAAFVVDTSDTFCWNTTSVVTVTERIDPIVVAPPTCTGFDIAAMVRGAFRFVEAHVELALMDVELLQSRTMEVFVFRAPACPDKPELPSWAWAWELSTPEGW